MASTNKPLESFDDKSAIWYLSSDNRQADRTATLDDVTTFIYQSLVDYQGKWEVSKTNEWTVKFPYARYLDIGNHITNTTTGEVYSIERIINEKTNTVRLHGIKHPELGDKMSLDRSNMIDFVSAYPQKQAEPETWKDTITYKVARREPGTIQSHPFEGRKEIKPRLRQTIIDPDFPNYHIEIMGQWFDNIIQFDCWSTTNRGADSLIEWFEDFVLKYTWVWKKNGVQEMLYMNRSIDEDVTKWRDDIVNRTLYYYFRTEKIFPIRYHDFEQFDIIANVSSPYYTPDASGISPSGGLMINDGGL